MAVKSTSTTPPPASGKTTEPAVQTPKQKAEVDAAAKAEAEKDAVGIGDVVGAALVDGVVNVLDPLHIVRNTAHLAKDAVDLATGTAGTKVAEGLEAVTNLRDAHRAIDQLKPGGEVEIGRKMEVEVDGVEGEGEVKVGVKNEGKDGFVVSFEQSGIAGAGIGTSGGHVAGAEGELEVGANAGVTGAVSFRVKTAAEAKALMDQGLVAMATGTVAPGADTLGLIASTLVNHEKAEAVTVSLDAGLAAEAGVKMPGAHELVDLGIKFEGEATQSAQMTWEAGPPAMAFIEVSVAAEGGAARGVDFKGGAASTGHASDVVEGTLTLRLAVQVGADVDPRTPEGQAAILKEAKKSGDVSIEFEGEVHVRGGGVVTVEREGVGNKGSIKDALTAFATAKNDVEVFKETGDKLSVGLRKSDFANNGKASDLGGGVELAWHVREKATKTEAEKAKSVVDKLTAR